MSQFHSVTVRTAMTTSYDYINYENSSAFIFIVDTSFTSPTKKIYNERI